MSTPRKSAHSKLVLRDLGDGLILRRSAPEDADVLSDFNAVVNSLTDQPDEQVRAWTCDLISGRLPRFDSEDFTIVEDTKTGAIVSTLNLISQTWSYGGVAFGAGRIELVSTHPDYRRRGLVRHQMEAVHKWSAERGEKVQGITGIPWFYGQFGYEQALERWEWCGRAGYKANVPDLGRTESERYNVRPATEQDVQFIAEVYKEAMQRYLVSCVRDEEMWRYELHTRSAQAMDRMELRVIETAEYEPVGLLVHRPWLTGTDLEVCAYELAPGVSWLAVTPSVLRYLVRTGDKYAARENKDRFGAFSFTLGTEHPVYRAIGGRLPRVNRTHAWYIRVANLPDFVHHIATVLERRLASSVAVGHSGELKISFVANGLKLVFSNGKVRRVEAWKPTQADSRLRPRARDALFPQLTFLQLLFGFRSVEELELVCPDCVISSPETRVLLNILFPKQPSRVWGIE